MHSLVGRELPTVRFQVQAGRLLGLRSKAAMLAGELLVRLGKVPLSSDCRHGQDHAMGDERQPCRGIVRVWRNEEGWGVIDSPETPGGCWAHFSHLAIEGYRTLTPGQSVELAWQAAVQDGYSYRAVRVVPLQPDPGPTD